jgi:hypothetical protein
MPHPKDWKRKQDILDKVITEIAHIKVKNYKMKTYVSIARFETLANRHVTMQRHSVIVIQGDAHPESGEYSEVELKYDGDGFILDGVPLMINSRPIGYGFKSSAIRGGSSRMSGGPMTWKDSAQAAIRLLSEKEKQAARGYCVAQDMAFLAYIGKPVG